MFYLLFSSSSLNWRISLSFTRFTQIKRSLNVTIFFYEIFIQLYVYVAKTTDYYYQHIHVSYQISIYIYFFFFLILPVDEETFTDD